MDPIFALKAVILGFIEGLTEFLPVSSTGHILLAESLLGLGFADAKFDKTFAVLIQLGAILALLGVYFRKILSIVAALPTDKQARIFALGVIVAFLPAAALGATLHGFIKGVLFNPWVVCVALISGGIVLLIVDDMRLERRYADATRFSLPMYFKIGLFQCAAMIPGVSRSGSTIVGAMLMGAEKRAAAEFSFFLSIPTMTGAFAYDLYKNAGTLNSDHAAIIAAGFAAAFFAGLLVVKGLLGYVGKHGFAVFGWWRIVIGSAGLAALILMK